LEVNSHGGDQSEEAALDFGNKIPFSSGGVKWIQTSYNNKFRKQYAGIGDYYDPVKNIFISKKPFNSWILDSNNDWQPPVAMPTIHLDTSVVMGKDNNNEDVYRPYSAIWDENNLRWTSLNSSNQVLIWNSINLVWE
jgi:hypothetical protein